MFLMNQQAYDLLMNAPSAATPAAPRIVAARRDHQQGRLRASRTGPIVRDRHQSTNPAAMPGFSCPKAGSVFVRLDVDAERLRQVEGGHGARHDQRTALPPAV